MDEKECSHCKKKLGKMEGEGVQCECCGDIFILCEACITDLHGAKCPTCGEFMAVFD